jgi:hypothetical protein
VFRHFVLVPLLAFLQYRWLESPAKNGLPDAGKSPDCRIHFARISEIDQPCDLRQSPGSLMVSPEKQRAVTGMGHSRRIRILGPVVYIQRSGKSMPSAC